MELSNIFVIILKFVGWKKCSCIVYAGTMRPSVLKCCILALYVPLRDVCSENVPA